MRTKKGYHRRAMDPFTDLLFNALMGITFLFLISIIFINPITKTGTVELKAEYIISITWKDFNPDDIDIWVESPQGSLVWFRNPEAGLLHLDRDDRGLLNDTIVINNEEVVNPLNQEVVTVRGIAPGDYVVNIHYYATQSDNPVDVHIKLERVNPRLEVVYYKTVTLESVGQEKTALRFTMTAVGNIINMHTLPKKLVTSRTQTG
ncbi:MAG: hypothetical protein GDA50_04425 [Alphaproteobacteria bacterium GM202ARS2]|nr:hypothetical protein [Alphaproteobacteria bacterium GM202ARS2]